MTWFTSDLHLYHDKEFLYRPRGFDNVYDMNNAIVNNWNAVVNDDDDVYVLGDLILSDIPAGLQLLKKLKGNIHIIVGNHDTDTKIEYYKKIPNVVEVVMAARIKYKKWHFYLSHYPTITNNGLAETSHLKENMICLYGHTHQNTNFFKGNPIMYHVGLDSHDMQLVEIEDIITECREKFLAYKEELANS